MTPDVFRCLNVIQLFIVFLLIFIVIDFIKDEKSHKQLIRKRMLAKFSISTGKNKKWARQIFLFFSVSSQILKKVKSAKCEKIVFGRIFKNVPSSFHRWNWSLPALATISGEPNISFRRNFHFINQKTMIGTYIFTFVEGRGALNPFLILKKSPKFKWVKCKN